MSFSSILLCLWIVPALMACPDRVAKLPTSDETMPKFLPTPPWYLDFKTVRDPNDAYHLFFMASAQLQDFKIVILRKQV